MMSKNKKGLWWSLGFVVAFASLMMFGLKQNSNFTPSALAGKQIPEFEARFYPIGQFSTQNLAKIPRWRVLNFWSSTCYVCKQEARELQEFYQNITLLNSQTPELLSVNIQDTVETVRTWQQTFKQTFPVILDKDGHISILFGVTGTPETFLIDPSGKVRYRIAGAINTNFLLDFIQWFESHPNASEGEARAQFIKSK